MKLSIITINRNNAEGLRKTMESVLSQTYRDFEYIIIDGASTDESVEVIKSFAPQPDMVVNGVHIRWISEPDTGIYNAMNKGIKMSTGEYSLMLNSGDYLVNDKVIESVLPELDGTDIIQGNIEIGDGKNTKICRGYGKSNISLFEALDGNFLHQASFINHQCYDAYGMYDDRYKKCADTYFYIKSLALNRATFKYVDINIANFDLNGISDKSNLKWAQIDKEEDAKFYAETIPPRLMDAWRAVPNKIKLYDTLHTHPFLWKCTMLLKIIAIQIDKFKCDKLS